MSKPESASRAAGAPVTFVCCVESGALEQEAVRLAASIRDWGGTLAESPILAITPRLGPPLDRATRRAFDDLEVTYIRRRHRRPYNWFKFMGKLRALEIAEQRAATDVIVWLDSDILLLGEPPGFRLPEQVDLGACPVSRVGGTTGPGDPNEPWWAAMCEAAGLAVDDLPWVDTLQDRKRIRLYVNSGVFAYRRSSGFLPSYEDCVHRILDARVSSQHYGIHFVDQVAVSLTAVRQGLRYRMWPEEYNYNVGHGQEKYHRPELLRRAYVLHYHNYMKVDAWMRLMELLEADRPEVAVWAAQHGPVCEPRLGGPNDMLRSAFKAYRKLRWSWFERTRARPV